MAKEMLLYQVLEYSSVVMAVFGPKEVCLISWTHVYGLVH